jgi:hypothetical protein
MSCDPSVEKKILLCIDEALGTLGEGGREALRNYFNRNVHLERDRIVEEPELFSKGLGHVLGVRGAKTLETWIVQRLVSSFELKSKSNLTLTQTIKMIEAVRKEDCPKVKRPPRRHYVSTDQHQKALEKRNVKIT